MKREKRERTLLSHKKQLHLANKCIHNTVMGVGTNFGVGVEEARPKGREWGWGSWGGDSQPLPTN